MKSKTRTEKPLVREHAKHSRKDYTLLKIIVPLVLLCAGFFGGNVPAGVVLAVLSLIIPSVKKVEEWERVVILRFGKFNRVAGPGLCVMIPVAERVSHRLDIRIRVTDFSAQDTLTGDSVTVNVDAFAFWLVWDPQKAALELEDYTGAVVLASKAALRNAVSSNSLSVFLERGDLIEKQIQEEVDRQTTEWGITVQYIEITDIQIPEELQNSLSRSAQAEAEKKARELLAEAEIKIAGRLEEAIGVYSKPGNGEGSPLTPALKLRILSILNEGLKAGNSMMLVPNSIADELRTRDVFGLEALNEINRNKEGK